MYKLRNAQVLTSIITVYREASCRVVNVYVIHSRAVGVDIAKPVKPTFLLPIAPPVKDKAREATPKKTTGHLPAGGAERSLDLGIGGKRVCDDPPLWLLLACRVLTATPRSFGL